MLKAMKKEIGVPITIVIPSGRLKYEDTIDKKVENERNKNIIPSKRRNLTLRGGYRVKAIPRNVRLNAIPNNKELISI